MSQHLKLPLSQTKLPGVLKIVINHKDVAALTFNIQNIQIHDKTDAINLFEQGMFYIHNSKG